MTLQTIGSVGATQQTTQVITIYQRQLMEPLLDLLPTLGYAGRYDIPQNAGQTISLRALGRLAAKNSPLTEGTTPTPSDLSISEVTATVSQHGDYVEWTDLFDMTSINITVFGVMEEQGRQAALSLHARALSIYVAGTNVSYVNGFSARNQIPAGAYCNKKLLDDVIKILSARPVPPITAWREPVQIGTNPLKTVACRPGYVAILTAAMWRRVKDIPGVASIEDYRGNGEGILPMEVGKYDKLRFVETTNATSLDLTGAGASSADVGAMLILGAGAIGVSTISGKALQPCLVPVNSPTQSDPLGQRGSVGWKATFSAVILNQSKMQRVEAAI